jgi:hypothetical protein
MQYQPFRKGARQPGPALDAMRRGRSASGMNSADITRAVQRMMRISKAKSRPDRPARPDRPKRPAR